jgi:hypothetical protein
MNVFLCLWVRRGSGRSNIIKSLLLLFLGTEESSFLKERSKELFAHGGTAPTQPRAK